MKKIICVLLAISMIAATAAILGGCGDDKSKKSDKDATTATSAATEVLSTTASTEVLSTIASTEAETLDPQEDDPTEDDPQEVTEEPATEQSYYDSYGGLTGQEAILKATEYAGAGYQCVYYDRQYLRNQEAWYIGVQAADGSDDAVYYLYVNANECVPVTEIPAIGGEISEETEEEVIEDIFAGISEQDAINKAIDSMEEDYTCVSSEQSEVGGAEYWLIGIQEVGDDSGEVLYFYVNSDACFQQ